MQLISGSMRKSAQHPWTKAPSQLLNMLSGRHAPTPSCRVLGIMAETEVSQATRIPQTNAPSSATSSAVTTPPVVGGSGAGGSTSDPVRPGLSQQQRASQRKAHARSFPRAKKLEKLGVFSACKVRGPGGDKRVWDFLRVCGPAIVEYSLGQDAVNLKTIRIVCQFMGSGFYLWNYAMLCAHLSRRLWDYKELLYKLVVPLACSAAVMGTRWLCKI